MAMIWKFGQIYVANQLYRGIDLFLHKNSGIPNAILRVKYPPATFHQLISRAKTSKAEIEYHGINEPTPTSSDTKDSEEPNETYSTFDHHYNDPFYVDKTLLIKKLLKVNHLLITAPSRFGKSLNMDMVRRFVQIELDENNKAIELDVEEDKPFLKEIQQKSKNFKLFQGKKIFHEKEIMYKYFGKYPTINIDFGGVQADDFNGILSRLREAVNRAFGEHVYLKYNSWRRSRFNKKDFMKYFDCQKSQLLTLAEVEVGLKILAQILYEYHGKKVFLFIEEFDVPVNSMVYEDKMSREDKENSIKLLQMMIKNVLKGSEKFVAGSLSNACQQLSGILSGSANNVRLCPFLQNHSLVEFYGFNKDEVKDLLERAGLSDHLNEVIAMYNGYNKKLENGDVVEISSPWAIIQYIRTKKFNKYWSAGIPSEIESVIGDSKIRSKIEEMMSGKSVDIIYKEKLKIKDIHTFNKIICRTEIDEREVDLCLQFLYEMGFFSLTLIGNDRLKLTVPNDSVRTALNDILYNADFKRNISIVVPC